MAATPTTMTLEDVECIGSEDEAKIDLELTCRDCGEHLADVEGGDTLGVLVSVFQGHARTAHGKEVVL